MTNRRDCRLYIRSSDYHMSDVTAGAQWHQTTPVALWLTESCHTWYLPTFNEQEQWVTDHALAIWDTKAPDTAVTLGGLPAPVDLNSALKTMYVYWVHSKPLKVWNWLQMLLVFTKWYEYSVLWKRCWEVQNEEVYGLPQRPPLKAQIGLTFRDLDIFLHLKQT